MRFGNQRARGKAVLATVFLVSLAGTAIGQDSSGPILPTDAGAWINSTPITAEMLKGKAALFYFYEES